MITLRTPGPAAARVTKREREVAGLVAQGLTNKGIAAQLHISPRTAEYHVGRLQEKLKVGSRNQLIAVVIEQGLAEYPPL
ncbi:MAG: response regulator transcription factor [Dehalococcoidia bacterium]